MPVALISDLHLDPHQPARLQALSQLQHRFSTSCCIDALYILGDLCEAWLGDDDDSPFARKLRSCLSELSARIPVFLMQGNRDFLLGAKFGLQTGVTLIPDPYTLEVAGSRYLLSHGDTLCTDDLAYMKARKVLRDDTWQNHFLAQTLDQRRRQAELMRKQSTAEQAETGLNSTDVNQQAVEELLQQHQHTKLVHGHTHRPGLHHFRSAGKNCQRWVLGDWHYCGWVLQLSAEDERLTCFSL